MAALKAQPRGSRRRLWRACRWVGMVVLAVPAVAVLASETQWWEHRVEPTYRLLADPDPRVLYGAPGVAGSRVALTIDDGPDAGTTPRILDVLERHEARATFFLTAGRVAGNGRVVERIIAEGHEVGNHMMADRPSIDLKARALERRLQEAEDILSRWQAPRWFRPASGWYDETMLRVAERHGYRTALGRVYPFDAMFDAPGFAARFIRWRAEPGEIIVLHDAGSRGRATARTLERVLPALDDRGLEVVTLSELVAPHRRSAGGS